MKRFAPFLFVMVVFAASWYSASAQSRQARLGSGSMVTSGRCSPTSVGGRCTGPTTIWWA